MCVCVCVCVCVRPSGQGLVIKDNYIFVSTYMGVIVCPVEIKSDTEDDANTFTLDVVKKMNKKIMNK